MWTRLRASVSRLLFVLSRRRLDEDARLEIDAHLDLLTERYSARACRPTRRYTAARRQFGNTALMRQDIHEMNSIGWIEQGAQDLRYALRQLRAQPGLRQRRGGDARPGHRRHDRRVQRRPGGAAGAAAVRAARTTGPLLPAGAGQARHARRARRRRTSRSSASMPRPSKTSRRSPTTPRPVSTW